MSTERTQAREKLKVFDRFLTKLTDDLDRSYWTRQPLRGLGRYSILESEEREFVDYLLLQAKNNVSTVRLC